MANPEHVEILKQGVEVWNKWRNNSHIQPNIANVNLSGEDLSGIDFQAVNLGGANFHEANLSKANLSGANLIRAELRGANLTRANLEECNLSWATLSWSLLNGATFRDANLHGTIFSWASVIETDFTNARFFYTSIANIDLSNSKGLKDAVHKGPSSVGIDTIYKSKGLIPENFLRGCGVQENFIRYMKSLTMSPFEYYSCFISYSHQDKPFARRLHDQLQARGIRCWLDEHQLLPGDDIYEQIDRGIRLWDKVLLCCSRHSLASWWVDHEVATAFNKEQQLMKDRKKKVLSLIPLNLDGYMFSDEWSSGKRQQIKERLAADFTGWEADNSKFEEQFNRVVKALRTEGTREEPPVRKL